MTYKHVMKLCTYCQSPLLIPVTEKSTTSQAFCCRSCELVWNMGQGRTLINFQADHLTTDDFSYLANPEIEKLETLPIDRHDSIFNNTETLAESIYPVYRETKGVTSKWFFHTVQKCFERGTYP